MFLKKNLYNLDLFVRLRNFLFSKLEAACCWGSVCAGLSFQGFQVFKVSKFSSFQVFQVSKFSKLEAGCWRGVCWLGPPRLMLHGSSRAGPGPILHPVTDRLISMRKKMDFLVVAFNALLRVEFKSKTYINGNLVLHIL